MSSDDTLRFKVTISRKANPELYQYIEEAGAYYRSKRMLQLSQLGLSVTKGNQAITTTQVTSAHQPASQSLPIIDSSSKEHNGYSIPEGASAAIAAMFDSLEDFGLKQSN